MNNYIVAIAKQGNVYWIDNRLYASPKSASNRKEKLEKEGHSNLGVYRIDRLIMDKAEVAK